MAVKPISPDDVIQHKQKYIPDEVMEAFNELIAKNFDGSSSCFKQDDIVALIIKKLGIEPDRRRVIYEERWLDIEGIYREAGWKVEYDKPGFNETYPATFTFKKSRK